MKGALRKIRIEVVTGERTPDRTRTRLLELRWIEVPPAQATDTDNVAADSADSADSHKSTAMVIPIHRT